MKQHTRAKKKTDDIQIPSTIHIFLLGHKLRLGTA